MRHTGIGVIGDVPWGTHFCQFYETSLDLAETLVPYFKAGLEAGEFCMWVTSEPLQVREAEAALRAAVPDLDERVRRGQIEIIDYQDWYFRSGRFSPDEVLKGWVDKLEAALDKGYEGLRLSGNTLWLEPVHWEDFREYEEAVNSLIGRRRHAEELEAARTAAENEKLRLEAVMEALPVGVAITDARGGSITTNSAYERVWAGPRPPTASVKDYAPYKAWWVDSGRPLAPEEWASAQVVEKGEPVVGQMLEIQKFDGSRAFVINSAAPVRDAGGNIAGSAVAIQDITELRESQKELQQLTETLEQRVRQRTVELAEANERLQAEVTYSHFIEADLKQQKETLQTLIDNIPVMLCFYDSEGRAKLTNREFERLLGWSREDAESLDIAPARSREAESGAGTEGLALAGIPGWREHNLRTREGAGLESSWATVRLSDGGQIGIGIDMRERKAAERGRDLVRQIITFSRQKEKERHPSKIGPVVQEALKFLRSMLATTIEIRENIPPEAGYIQADPTQIHQIVMNLANNSAYAMRERGGVLDVRLAEVEVDDDLVLRCPDLKSGPHLKLTVADTGTGMPPEVIDRAFDPFFTTKKPGEGSGMGLAVVHGIVRDWAGAIIIESEVGKGTTVSVFFPRVLSAESEASPTAEPAPGGRERILLVDDEESQVQTMRTMLKRLGHSVVSRTNPVNALRVFRKHPSQFDLVITDLTMPKLTGAQLAEEMLRLRPDLPIILCTGFSENVDASAAFALGLSGFLMKPFSIREMAAAISQALKKN